MHEGPDGYSGPGGHHTGAALIGGALRTFDDGCSGAGSTSGREMTNQAPLRTEDGYRLGEPFSLDNIDAAMAYHPWSGSQIEKGDIVREALTLAAKAILRHVPAGPYRTVAIRKLLEARMDANAAITFRGRF
jgi:hypothetical protein